MYSYRPLSDPKVNNIYNINKYKNLNNTEIFNEMGQETGQELFKAHQKERAEATEKYAIKTISKLYKPSYSL